MGRALLTVSAELFRDVLCLPDATVVAPRDIVVVVEHPDIPTGTTTVTPTFRRDGAAVCFVEWGAA